MYPTVPHGLVWRLATNAITTWTAEHLGLAVDHMRAQGRRVYPDLLVHVSPAQSDNIVLFGTITVDIDAELARLDPTGHRPLRNGQAVVTASV